MLIKALMTLAMWGTTSHDTVRQRSAKNSNMLHLAVMHSVSCDWKDSACRHMLHSAAIITPKTVNAAVVQWTTVLQGITSTSEFTSAFPVAVAIKACK